MVSVLVEDLRAAASRFAVSDYVHGELVRLARHPTVDDSRWGDR